MAHAFKPGTLSLSIAFDSEECGTVPIDYTPGQRTELCDACYALADKVGGDAHAEILGAILDAFDRDGRAVDFLHWRDDFLVEWSIAQDPADVAAA